MGFEIIIEEEEDFVTTIHTILSRGNVETISLH
jgi:hypothetical protein